ncbi:MAG: hypothetical protein QM622_03275 [Microbacterium sp.]
MYDAVYSYDGVRTAVSSLTPKGDAISVGYAVTAGDDVDIATLAASVQATVLRTLGVEELPIDVVLVRDDATSGQSETTVKGGKLLNDDEE